jgi:hypothetical protein
MKLPGSGLLAWVKANLSNGSSVSNSRTLQTLIVVNILVMLWLVLNRAGWSISDNARLVLLCLITGGAGSYIVGKIGGSNGSPS